jgi:hypothetical protein
MDIEDDYLLRTVKLYKKHDKMYNEYEDFLNERNHKVGVKVNIYRSKYTIMGKIYREISRCLMHYHDDIDLLKIETKLNELKSNGLIEEAEKEASALLSMLDDNNPNNALRYFNEHGFTIFGAFCLFLIMKKYNTHTLVNLTGEVLGIVGDSVLGVNGRVSLSGNYGEVLLSEISFLEGNRIDKLNEFVL